MICCYCRQAGRLTRGEFLNGVKDAMRHWHLRYIRQMHSRCPGGNRCDCQHRIQR